MSFDMGPMGNLSNVQKSAKSCAGGGGNTGYFSRNGGEEDENIVEFAKDYPNDSFEKIDIKNIEQEEKTDFLTLLKDFFKKVFKTIRNLFTKKQL